MSVRQSAGPPTHWSPRAATLVFAARSKAARLLFSSRRRGGAGPVSCLFVLAHSSSPQRAYSMGVEQQLIGAHVERLRQFRPQVDVDPEAIYLRDGNVWTSAGVTAGIDLALALIEADFGRAIALAVARRHVVFRIRPGGQGQFSPELAAQGIRHHRLSKLAEKIAEGPHENWRTDTLAAEAGVSPRSLSRLFRKELNASPSQFVERVRIDQARRALLETEAQIENVAIRCGFGSLRRMDRAFSRAISATPTEFRARFKAPGAPG